MDNTQLQAMRDKIANSFLRSFFPVDDRGMRNDERNLDNIARVNNTKLQKTSSLTSKIALKMQRILSLVSQEVDEAIDAADRLKDAIARSDENAALTGGNTSNVLGWLGDLILGGYLAKKVKDVVSGKKKAEVKVEEETKLKSSGDSVKSKVKTDAELRGPEFKGPEIAPPKAKFKMGGKVGALLTIGGAVGATMLANKAAQGIEEQKSEAAQPQPLSPPIPGPPAVPAPPEQQVAPLSGPVIPLPPPDMAGYSPAAPDTRGQAMKRATDQAQRAAEQQVEQFEGSAGSGGGTTGGNDNVANIQMGPSGLDSGASFEEGAPNMAVIRTSSGMSTQVNAMLAPNFQGFINALEATGYKIGSLGGVAKRNIAGTNTRSWHYWGAAIDINPGANPHLKDGTMRTDMPPDVGAIAANFGLGWGGNWRSSKDTMHFSAAANEGGRFNIDRMTGQIQPLAKGGKVSGPTLALIGERQEPEYVVPQSKAKAFAHEMMADTPRTITKKKTHYVVLPIIT